MVGIAEQYYGGLSKMKETLFGFYKERGVSLGKKYHPRGLGTTWGYRLTSPNAKESGDKASGASIGEDEIRLFYDICSLVSPSVSYVIGHSFGLSTLALALSNPRGIVIAIDNWSEGSEMDLMRRLASDMEKEFKNRIYVHSGTSPADTPKALSRAGGGEKLSLVLIDGLHTNGAAYNDFKGVYDYIDSETLILWHGAPYVYQGVLHAWQICTGLYDKTLCYEHGGRPEFF